MGRCGLKEEGSYQASRALFKDAVQLYYQKFGFPAFSFLATPMGGASSAIFLLSQICRMIFSSVQTFVVTDVVRSVFSKRNCSNFLQCVGWDCFPVSAAAYFDSYLGLSVRRSLVAIVIMTGEIKDIAIWNWESLLLVFFYPWPCHNLLLTHYYCNHDKVRISIQTIKHSVVS